MSAQYQIYILFLETGSKLGRSRQNKIRQFLSIKKMTISNYRPGSLLLVSGKVFEKIIFNLVIIH